LSLELTIRRIRAMSVPRYCKFLFAAAFLASAALGCGESGRVRVYPVKGKISFEGRPMAGGGSISLVPLASQAGKTAGGVINEDGTYELMTYKAGDGSMTGEFRVVITQAGEKEPPRTKDGEAPAAATSTVAEADRIPAIYSDSQNSPLKATVEAKAQEINFDLQRSAAPPPIIGAG
jgi:hypothetical protein